MTTFELFTATYLLYTRLGYITDLEAEEVQPGDDVIRGINDAMEYLEPMIGLFTGVPASFRPMLHFPLPDLTAGERSQMVEDWKRMISVFDLAGLNYHNGMPLVHAIVLADSFPSDRIESLLEEVHAAFKSFADRYLLAATQYGSNLCTICFAYQQKESLSAIKQNIAVLKDKSSFWARTHTTCWVLDLNNLEMLSSRGLANWGIRASEYLSGVFSSKKRKSIFPDRQWQQFIQAGSIPPNAFSTYLKKYHADYKSGKLEVPKAVSDHLMRRIREKARP